MFTEHELVCQLLDDQIYECTEPYNPYRTKNVLKDSNKPLFPEASHKSKIAFEKRNSKDLKTQFNNCKSLKKVLEKLKTQHSPERKQQQNISRKQNIEVSKKYSGREKIGLSTSNGSNLSAVYEKFELKKQKVIFLPSRLLTQDSSQLKRSDSKNQEREFEKQEEIIRSLIKKKVSEKQQFKIRNTSQKTTIHFKQNDEAIKGQRKNSSSSKLKSRKLMHLFF